MTTAMPTIDPVLDWTVRSALLLLLGVAVAHKLSAPRRFAATLADYQVLPARLAAPAAALVVAAEIGVVLALAVERRIGLGAAAALLVLYGAAIALNLLRGRRHIDCGCAGPAARRPISGWLAGRNGVLAALALAASVPVTPRPLVWLDAFTVVAATAALAACWTAADGLLALRPLVARVRGAT